MQRSPPQLFTKDKPQQSLYRHYRRAVTNGILIPDYPILGKATNDATEKVKREPEPTENKILYDVKEGKENKSKKQKVDQGRVELGGRACKSTGGR